VTNAVIQCILSRTAAKAERPGNWAQKPRCRWPMYWTSFNYQ
jgi:hypothetical protein